MMMTLDGYYEGPNQEFDFWVTDEEFRGLLGRATRRAFNSGNVLLYYQPAAP
jgi:hypothetical protein